MRTRRERTLTWRAIGVAATMSLGLGVAVAPSEARAETWACYDRSAPNAAPVFSNGKKRGMRCVLFSPSQRFPPAPRGAPPRDGADAPDAATESADADVSGAARRLERFTPPPPGRGGAADEPPRREDREALYGPYIEEAAALYDIPEAFIRAIIRVESNYTYRAVSPVGAMGLMQLMPVTARELGVMEPFDPRQNILGGARLLRRLANRHGGDIVKVLSSYCSGSGAVARADGQIPSEAAERYVRGVLDYYYQYKSLGAR